MAKSAFAKRRGVAPSAVSNWIKRGVVIVRADERGRECIDVLRSEALLAGMVDSGRGRPTKASLTGEAPAEVEAESATVVPIGTRNLTNAKADLTDEQLYGQRMKNARDAGQLVALAEQVRRMSELGRLTRERIKSALRGAAERIAAEAEPRTTMVLLDELIDAVFADLADLVAAGGLLSDGDDASEPDAGQAAPEAAT